MADMDWQITDDLSARAFARTPVPMQQHPFYGRACAAIGSRVVQMSLGGAAMGADPPASAQVLVRRWPLFGDFALIARGPVWDPGTPALQTRQSIRDLCATLRRTCRGVMITSERLEGEDLADGQGLLPLVTPGSQARLALGSPDEMLARQRGKWRNRLRRAQDGPLRVSHAPLPDEPDHWLLLREEAQSKRRRYRRLPMQFTAAWRATNGARSTRLFVARYGKVPVAAMLFLLHGGGASYHIGWSDELGRQCHAHNLLLWEASRWLSDRGYSWIDLGTLDTESTPGLARFKLGAGAQPLMLGTTFLDAPGARPVAWLFGHRQNRARGLPGRADTLSRATKDTARPYALTQTGAE